MNSTFLKKSAIVALAFAALIVHADYGKYKKYMNRAKKYYKEKKYENAAAFFLKAERQAYDANSLAAAMVNRGNCLVVGKNYELAAKVFRKVIADPKTPNNYRSGALKALGAVLFAQGKHAAAIAQLKECLKIKKISSGVKQEALWLLGSCYFDTGQFNEAEKVFRQMLSIKKLPAKFKKKVEKKLKEITDFK